MFCCNLTFGQNSLYFEGVVLDPQSNPIPSSSVILSNVNGEILAYTITDQKGTFKIPVPTIVKSCTVSIKNLGYDVFTKEIDFSKVSDYANLTFVLKEKLNNLDEVVIKSTRPITEKKDTLIFNADFYTTPTDRSIEDVLKNIPGISVASDGTIKYGNQEIKKILIDGDDMVDQQYTILSKNLDPKIVESIQVLKNFDSNPLRKKYGNGNDVALNLTVKENFKNIFFGKVDAGLGTDNRFDNDVNIGFLSGKFKALHLTNYNTIGEVQEDISSFSGSNLDDLKDTSVQRKNTLQPTLRNNFFPPPFLENEEKLINESTLISNSLHHKFNKKSNLRAAFTYRENRTNFDQFNLQTFNTAKPISFSEDVNLKEQKPAFLGNFTYTFYNEKNIYFTWESLVESGNPNWNQQIITQNENISTINDSKERNINNHLKMTYRPQKNLTWDNYVYQTSQKIQENDFLSSSEDVKQEITKQEHLYGISSKITFQKNRNVFNLQAGVEEEYNELATSVQQNNSSSNAERNLHFTNSIATVTLKHTLRDSTKFSFESGITYKKSRNTDFDNFFLPMLGINLQRSLKGLGQFSIGYTFKNRLSDLDFIYPQTLFTSYRNAGTGLTSPFKVKLQSISILHNKQVLGKNFFWFNLLSYSHFDKGVISFNTITEDTTLFSLSEGRGGTSFLAQTNTTTYIKPLSTSVKFSIGYTYLLNYLAINESNISTSKSNTIDFDIDMTSYISNKFLLKTTIKSLYQENTFQNQKSGFASYALKNELSYTFSEYFTAAAKNHLYSVNKEAISFLSLALLYKLPKTKWEFSLRHHNIFNQNNFTANQFDDFVTSRSSTQLLNSYVLLNTIYRF